MLTVSEAVLADEEKEEGVLLIDVADSMTEFVLWKGGRLAEVRNAPWGGRHLSERIAREWNLDLHDAEKLKERFATMEAEARFGDELIPLLQRNGKPNQQIRRQEFQDKFLAVAEEWLREIFKIGDELTGQQQLQHPHYVFSGGGTSFNGFLEFVNQRFQREARMGLSRKMEAAHELLVDPSLTPALGMYRWLCGQALNQARLMAPRSVVEKTLATARDWFYSYF